MQASHPSPQIHVVAHADWSLTTKKRWITVARRDACNTPWTIDVPQRVNALLGKGVPTDELPARIAATHHHTLIGLDLPLGVPRIIGTHTGLERFHELLEHVRDGTPTWREFLTPCEQASQISAYRPFYPRAPRGSRRAHLIEGLDAHDWSDLLRRGDAPEPGGAKPCPLFWCVGANQVGKAAITGWRELLIPLLNKEHIKMWPFDGRLDDLTASRTPCTIMVEVYPAEVYQWLKFDWGNLGKRTQTGRLAQSDKLLDALDTLSARPSPGLQNLIMDGFGQGATGEDPFDSLVGVVGMLHILGAKRPLFEPEDTTTRSLEGWIFGRHAIDHRTSP